MAKRIVESLTEDLLRRLDGHDLSQYSDKVILAISVDENGWPHPALLSYFEVVAKDPGNVRLVTYGDSRTTGNIRRNGKLTLVIIDTRVVYYVKGTGTELAGGMRSLPHSAKLNLLVIEVLADEPNDAVEPGAYVSSGITYASPQRAAGLERAKLVIAELLD